MIQEFHDIFACALYQWGPKKRRKIETENHKIKAIKAFICYLDYNMDVCQSQKWYVKIIKYFYAAHRRFDTQDYDYFTFSGWPYVAYLPTAKFLSI